MKKQSNFRTMTAIAIMFAISFSAYAQTTKTLQTQQKFINFVAVTGITDVTDKATAGTPLTLTGTIVPANATNKTIAWSVVSAGTTGAKIERGGSAFNATEAGTVTIKATIANGVAEGKDYTQEFTITVREKMTLPITRLKEIFVAVEEIFDVPDKATSGKPLTLTSRVTPENATNKTIEWKVLSAGTTGAKINGNAFTATAAGTALIRATIAKGLAEDKNFWQDFKITVSNIAVTGITDVPDKATTGTPLTLTGTVAPANATSKTIAWSMVSAGTTGAKIEKGGSAFNATAAGTVTIRATIANGAADGTNYTQDFTITVSDKLQLNRELIQQVQLKDAFVAVTGISDVSEKATVNTPLTLTGTVAPANATNKTIVWSVVSAGTTKAKIEKGGSAFNASEAGTVTIRATIANGVGEGKDFTKDFTITVSEPVTRLPIRRN